MRDLLRFSVVCWHTFCGTGSDPFGIGTMQRSWNDGLNKGARSHTRTGRSRLRLLGRARIREYDLMGDLKLNIKTNHATLAGHTMQHELEVVGAADALGSIDANTGDELIGWDTDQFHLCKSLICKHILKEVGEVFLTIFFVCKCVFDSMCIDLSGRNCQINR